MFIHRFDAFSENLQIVMKIKETHNGGIIFPFCVYESRTGENAISNYVCVKLADPFESFLFSKPGFWEPETCPEPRIVAGRSGTVLLAETKEMSEWLRTHLAAVGGLPHFCSFFFHPCPSFRKLILGVVPVSLHSTLIINNPLEVCSFYYNNRRACLAKVYRNTESSGAFDNLRLPCLNWPTETATVTNKALLWVSPLHRPDKFLLGGSGFTSLQCLFARVTCLMTLLSSPQTPLWPIKPGCICSTCPPCGWENILNPPDTQLKRAPTWPPMRKDTNKKKKKKVGGGSLKTTTCSRLTKCTH